MKLIDRARLGFREGNSDKVYEVDLLEVASDQHVVNFRYGRRGTALRDGTKTPVPVSLDRARAIFSALIAEKTKGGYRPLTAEAEAQVPPARAPGRVDPAAREARTIQELLAALGRGHRGEIPLHLTVRKVGERGLSQAEPLLLELLAPGPPQPLKREVFRHLVIAALARCGSARSLPHLRPIAEDTRLPRHLRDIARLALTMLGGAAERERERAGLASEFKPTTSHDLPQKIGTIERLLVEDPARAHAAIVGNYLTAAATSDESESELERLARQLVLALVRVTRPQRPELGILRTLTWAAEIRRDAELFALLARRFEGDRSTDTVNYFRRRAARTLRRLAGVRSPDYVRFASALLLSYRDSDAETPVRTDRGSWDKFAGYAALNYVLYGNSARYEPAGHRRATWRCTQRYQPGTPPPNEREESHPALWDRMPEQLWRLGVSDAAAIVVHFAVCALRAQEAYLAQLTDETVGNALARAQPEMRGLAFEVAQAREPNLVLARAALESGLEAAGNWVLAWLEKNPQLLATEMDLLAALVTAPSALVREAIARRMLGFRLGSAQERELVLRCIALLIQLPDAASTTDRARTAARFLALHARSVLADVSLEVMRDLLSHPAAGIAELGATIVLERARASTLPAGLLDSLLGSRHGGVRAIGASIVAETPIAVLKNEPDLLVHFALTENAELRAGTRPLFAALAREYPDTAREVASRLLEALLGAQPAGAPAHAVSLLRHELDACLPRRSAEQVLALIGALSPHAREAGGLLLAQLGPDELELETIVRLASHEILAIRRGSWALARAARDRFRVSPLALARLCDARWEDSRAFAFDFVRGFTHSELGPSTLIAICDSVEPAVQRFGQELLLDRWREEDAERYLSCLSEHPSSNVQLLVSGLLARYARGNLRLIAQLLPCFTTILTQVNRGGVAKQRVLEFLRTEAVASADAAALLAPLLARQSLTNAVSHKGPLIATMVALHERYPEIAVPIASRPAPLRARSNRGI